MSRANISCLTSTTAFIRLHYHCAGAMITILVTNMLFTKVACFVSCYVIRLVVTEVNIGSKYFKILDNSLCVYIQGLFTSCG